MPKKLIVFCDGTWNQSDQMSDNGRACPTNVFRLFQATEPLDQDGNPQVVHYIEGVGTRRWERLRGGGFGYGISANIQNAYCFLVSNYAPGDEIFLFGFSRGAYTARSIAGLIRNVGILRRNKLHLVKEAYGYYTDRSDAWHPQSENAVKFRTDNTHGKETIRFLGVWDTVGALGAPFGAVLGWIIGTIFKTRFHDTKLSSIIESAYHALAIDERRWPFRPTLWELSPDHKARNAGAVDTNGGIPYYEEQWFPGVHSNVGGGYADSGLADYALDWMAKRAQHYGMTFNFEALDGPEFKPNVKVQPENSQTPLIRWATRIFVKWPSLISIHLVFPSRNRPYVSSINRDGDYIRPIDNQSELSESARLKIAQDESYQPENVA